MQKIIVYSQKEFEKMISDAKRDLLFNIILDMRRYKLTLSQASEMASEFLSLESLPHIESFLSRLLELSKYYSQIRRVFIKYAKKYSEKQKEMILGMVPTFIGNKEFDNAIELLKGGSIYGSDN